jgi:hypothetical protein
VRFSVFAATVISLLYTRTEDSRWIVSEILKSAANLLAWELAHQLENLGREIEFVVLVETRSFNARRPFRIVARLTRFIAAVARGKISEKFKFDAMRAIWGRIKRPVYYGPFLRVTNDTISHLHLQNQGWFATEKSLQRVVQMPAFPGRAEQHRYPNQTNWNAHRRHEARLVLEFAMNRSSHTRSINSP